MNRTLNLLWIAVTISYTLMIAGVGTQYPRGPIVASVLCVLAGGTLFTILYKRKELQWGKSYVLQSYLLAYMFSFVVVFVYGIMFNFKGRNDH
jgi:hypothetical protein